MKATPNRTLDRVRSLAAEERAFWARVAPEDPETGALLADRTAALALQAAVLEDQAEALAALDPGFRARLPILTGDAPPPGASERAHRAWTLAAPVEILLTLGGDNRLGIDPATGLNAYGCSPRPRPWAVTFASTTATSVSTLGYGVALSARERLLTIAAEGDVDSAIAREMDIVRQALRTDLDLGPVDVVLCPSGTDGELYAIEVVRDGAPIVNILVGPEETGGGVPRAAAGRHFAPVTALGRAVTPGDGIAGFVEAIEVQSVDLRDDAGAPRPLAAIDADVTALTNAAVARGARVLIHRVDASKTGLAGPSLDALDALKDVHGARVDVIVDACQMRLGPASIRDFLDRGFMVLLTASKFLTAPPFAAALVVPQALSPRMRRRALSAPGLSAYVGLGEWPLGWPRPAGPLPRANPGLLLRWLVGIAEMRAFLGVAPETARAILESFMGRINAAARARGALRVLPTTAISRARDPVFDGLSTILTFAVAGPRGDLDLDDLRRMHRLLNADLGPGLLGRRCHIGQPVTIGAGAALRLSAGARLVYGVAGDPQLGPDPASRLEAEIADATTALDKIASLAADWDQWRNAPVPADRPR